MSSENTEFRIDLFSSLLIYLTLLRIIYFDFL